MLIVQSLVQHLVYLRREGLWSRGRTFATTDAELVTLATRLDPSVAWDEGGSDLLAVKQDLIDRFDSGPARRHAFAREVVRGDRRAGEAVGRPSEYEPTGLLDLLAAYDTEVAAEARRV